MAPAIERAFTESDAVLIEEFIKGREFGCGVWITADGIRALPVTEIKSHKEFFDYEAKYTAGMPQQRSGYSGSPKRRPRYATAAESYA